MHNYNIFQYILENNFNATFEATIKMALPSASS